MNIAKFILGFFSEEISNEIAVEKFKFVPRHGTLLASDSRYKDTNAYVDFDSAVPKFVSLEIGSDGVIYWVDVDVIYKTKNGAYVRDSMFDFNDDESPVVISKVDAYRLVTMKRRRADRIVLDEFDENVKTIEDNIKEA